MSIEYLILTGTVLGITAGISPGPLLMLVISQTIRFGRREGVKVSLTPLITDAPIILAAVFLLNTFQDMDILLGALSFMGACYLVHLGMENLKAQPLHLSGESSAPSSIIKGITANFLNPHPYIFWASVGSPILLKALQGGAHHVFAFLLSFYVCIVCSKITIAFLVERVKNLFATTAYVYTLKALGIGLLLFAAMFALDAFKYIMKALPG